VFARRRVCFDSNLMQKLPGRGCVPIDKQTVAAMLHDFWTNNFDELARRCRVKVVSTLSLCAAKAGKPGDSELTVNDVPSTGSVFTIELPRFAMTSGADT
jgi:hypothetical protein